MGPEEGSHWSNEKHRGSCEGTNICKAPIARPHLVDPLLEGATCGLVLKKAKRVTVAKLEQHHRRRLDMDIRGDMLALAAITLLGIVFYLIA